MINMDRLQDAVEKKLWIGVHSEVEWYLLMEALEKLGCRWGAQGTSCLEASDKDIQFKRLPISVGLSRTAMGYSHGAGYNCSLLVSDLFTEDCRLKPIDPKDLASLLLS